MVTFYRPGAVSLSISLLTTGSLHPPGHNAKLPPPLQNGIPLSMCGKVADISYSRACSELLLAHFHLFHFARADGGVFEVGRQK